MTLGEYLKIRKAAEYMIFEVEKNLNEKDLERILSDAIFYSIADVSKKEILNDFEGFKEKWYFKFKDIIAKNIKIKAECNFREVLKEIEEQIEIEKWEKEHNGK